MIGKTGVDVTRLAAATGGDVRGRVESGAGWFGALALVEEVRARFRAPRSGGRATDPRWTERRLVPFAPETLAQLAGQAAELSRRSGTETSPLQLAALLVEHGLATPDVAWSALWRQMSPEQRDLATRVVGELLRPSKVGLLLASEPTPDEYEP